MTDNQDRTTRGAGLDPDSRLEEALDAFAEAHEDGLGPDPRDYYRRYSEIAGPLKDAIERYLYAAEGIGRDETDLPERIGPYRIHSVIGEGGMGVVYRAEQRQPVRRQVALKLIKPGMDSKAIIARFEAERQALALMDHPHIAQVLEAGTSEDRRPYFVMEYIPGTPITRYCEENRVSIEERLRLFQKICEAVQHAHQKAILHRDLKPSNILVTRHGDEAIPKIIDFGLAKALGHELTEQSLLTEQGMLVGTPEYMSPEQVDPEVPDVDTRADIYSLGVILYRLLTGMLPVDMSEYRRVANLGAFEAIRRRICEEEPKRPSTRVGENGVSDRPERSGDGRTDPSTWRRRLRGDLDWITMKALAKDRSRRYSAATDLAADIERHLNREPVHAGPPSAAYRLEKFILRNRIAVTSGLLILFLLVAGGVTSTAFYFQAEEARGQAVAGKRSAEERLEAFERMADVKRLADRVREADEDLWPAWPDKIPLMNEWLAKSERMLERLELHRSERDRLRSELALPPDPSNGEGDGVLAERTEWRFADDEDQWMHDTIAKLVAGLEAFAAMPGEESGTPRAAAAEAADTSRGPLSSMRDRIALAKRIGPATIEAYRAEWSEAIASIRDRQECPMYDGLELPVQIGLIPIGRDPDSGLWEFGVWEQTGPTPERGEDGRLILEDRSGMVLVLIPAGSFTIGSPPSEPARRPDEAQHEVALEEPFFLSKYEMTQGQWQALTGSNPSFYGPNDYSQDWDRLPRNGKLLWLHPVEAVDWYTCDRVLRQIGLVLPTEAQWEYAARAGTTGIWFTGSNVESLRGAANLLDQYARQNGAPVQWGIPEDFDDGFVTHAPVGRLRPNAFGLNDVVGNVWEHCRDGYASYDLPTAPADGERLLDSPPRSYVTRGGSFNAPALQARSADRSYDPPEFRDVSTGVRPARVVAGLR